MPQPPPFNLDRQTVEPVLWFFTGGAILTLLRSLIDGSRRNASRLLVGCIFGGIGSTLVGYTFSDRWWVFPACGVAAIVTDHVVIGLSKAGDDFSKNPISTFKTLWDMLAPQFLKGGTEKPTANPEAVG